MNGTAPLTKTYRRIFSRHPNEILQPFGLQDEPSGKNFPLAQVSIELTAALIGCILLLTGILKIFYWINQSIIDQQFEYQRTRITPNADFTYAPKKLDLFR
jgi:archaellum biogenesis protein FlaJ (TadC family)